MDKNRMEAFSDAVIAIIITIMVLELKIPHGTEWSALKPLTSVFICYIMSFAYLAIYWNNHHHLLKAIKSVDGKALWANMVLLFWLSLIPFVTGWMGENHFAKIPVLLYGINLLCAAVSYNILVKVLIASHGQDSLLAKAVGKDTKGKLSMMLYVLAIGVAFLIPLIACAIFALVAVIWLIPDQRIEKILK